MNSINLYKILNVIGLIGVITVNTLANTLPINGKSTGEVSAQFENLFTPAGLTFSIWSVIYLGLLGFAYYQASYAKPTDTPARHPAVYLGLPFLISCAANIAWIFAWHHQYFAITLVCMSILLISLIVLNIRSTELRQAHPSGKYTWLVWGPLGLYLGWICIATIANMAVYLTAIEWGQWGVSAMVWAVVLSVIGALVGLFLLRQLGLIPAAIAIAWGLFGLFMKQYQTLASRELMITYVVLIALLLIGIARTLRRSSPGNT